jgi:ribosomal-protein-alanine N-acetyltransferase
MLNHKGTQTIETQRLILRKAIREDAQPMFYNWASDPEVTKFLTWPTYEKVDTAHTILNLWISEYENPEFYQWMIVPKDSAEPIGTISVVRQNEETEEAEVGYCIGSEWWHQGITSEAMAAAIAFLFKEVGMKRVTARHDPNNPNSGKVMIKCGMKYLGTTIAADKNNQGICDAAYYEILNEDL